MPPGLPLVVLAWALSLALATWGEAVIVRRSGAW